MKSVPPHPMFAFSLKEMSTMISTEVFMDIISLHRQGLSMRAIAKRLNGCRPGTVAICFNNHLTAEKA